MGSKVKADPITIKIKAIGTNWPVAIVISNITTTSRNWMPSSSRETISGIQSEQENRWFGDQRGRPLSRRWGRGTRVVCLDRFPIGHIELRGFDDDVSTRTYGNERAIVGKGIVGSQHTNQEMRFSLWWGLESSSQNAVSISTIPQIQQRRPTDRF
jgi:hypothetical protein